jgi:hypothetical protein
MSKSQVIITSNERTKCQIKFLVAFMLSLHSYIPQKGHEECCINHSKYYGLILCAVAVNQTSDVQKTLQFIE